MRVWPTGSATIHRHAKKDVFPKLYEQVCVGEGKNVVDDNTNHREARMVFLAMNSIDISEEAKVLTVIKTDFVERLYEDALEQKREDEVKGYENHGLDTRSKSSLLFDVK